MSPDRHRPVRGPPGRPHHQHPRALRGAAPPRRDRAVATADHPAPGRCGAPAYPHRGRRGRRRRRAGPDRLAGHRRRGHPADPRPDVVPTRADRPRPPPGRPGPTPDPTPARPPAELPPDAMLTAHEVTAYVGGRGLVGPRDDRQHHRRRAGDALPAGAVRRPEGHHGPRPHVRHGAAAPAPPGRHPGCPSPRPPRSPAARARAARLRRRSAGTPGASTAPGCCCPPRRRGRRRGHAVRAARLGPAGADDGGRRGADRAADHHDDHPAPRRRQPDRSAPPGPDARRRRRTACAASRPVGVRGATPAPHGRAPRPSGEVPGMLTEVDLPPSPAWTGRGSARGAPQGDEQRRRHPVRPGRLQLPADDQQRHPHVRDPGAPGCPPSSASPRPSARSRPGAQRRSRTGSGPGWPPARTRTSAPRSPRCSRSAPRGPT